MAKLKTEEMIQANLDQMKEQNQPQNGDGSHSRQLTTAAAFLQKQRSEDSDDLYISLPCGTFKIRPISMIQATSITGSVLLNQMRDAVLGIADRKSRQSKVDELVSNLSEDERIQYAEDNQRLAENVICMGVESLNFRRKPSAECDVSKNEASVFAIPPDEAQLLANTILELTTPQEGVDSVASFRGLDTNGDRETRDADGG